MPLQTLLFGTATVRFLEWCQRRYGDLFWLRLPGSGGRPAAFLADPDALRRLYARDAGNRVPMDDDPFIGPMFGSRSIFFSDGAEHLRKRRLLLPPFHGE